MQPPSKRPLSPPPSSQPSTPPHDPTPLPPFLTLTPPLLRHRFKAINAHEAALRAAPSALYAHPIAHARNRYADIRPWAHNRVQLRELDFPYINASPIALDGEACEYIAAQGPLDSEEGRRHFWEMCWQEGVEVVVMLTQAVEEGREKCAVYYPEEVEGCVEMEGWGRVECVGLSEEWRTEVRECRVVKVFGEGEERREEVRTVWHFLFLGWPDMDVPKETAEILELIKMSRFRIDGVPHGETKEKIKPRVVHCSAGVGRTGTFIALDYLLRQFEDGELDDLLEESEMGKDVDPIVETVKRLREQRMLMVYQPAQFAFIYQVLREKWLARKNGLEKPEIKSSNYVDEGSPTKKRKSMGDAFEAEIDTSTRKANK